MLARLLSFLDYLPYLGYGIIGILIVSLVGKPIQDFLDLLYYSIIIKLKSSSSMKKRKVSYIEIMIEQIYGRADKGKVGLFYFSTIIMAVIGFIAVRDAQEVYLKIILPIILGSLPYIYLKLKVRTMIIEGSYEGIAVTSELLQQYRLSNFNMPLAIEKTVSILNSYSDGKVKFLNKYLTRLGVRINGYLNDEELDEMIYIFYRSVDTEWGNMLANNIAVAVRDGIDVSPGLEDILKELKEAKKIQEYGERKSFEGFMVGKFMMPVMYIASIIIANQFFGFDVEKFFRYQTQSKAGSTTLVLMLGLYVGNILISATYKKRKFDF